MTAPPAAPVGVRVYGVPYPKGSLHCLGPHRCRRCGSGIAHPVTEDDKTGNGATWRAKVENAARKLRRALDATIAGPVWIDATFTMPRPANARLRRWPWVRPDLDKLARMLLDCLTTGAVIADDGRVVELTVRKVYPCRCNCSRCHECLDEPGVAVRVLDLDAATAEPRPPRCCQWATWTKPPLTPGGSYARI